MNEGFGLKGVVEKQLFSTEAWEGINDAIDNGMEGKELQALKNSLAKPLFQDNRIWRFIKNTFGLDLKIPFVTGFWTTQPVVHNTITTKGKEVAVDQLFGGTTAPVTAIAIGIGTGGTTALNSEITTGGGERGAGSYTNSTTTTTNDTGELQKTFSFTSSFAVTEEGLLDNNTSGGNLFAYQTFSAINVTNGDTLQITHKVQAT